MISRNILNGPRLLPLVLILVYAELQSLGCQKAGRLIYNSI